MARYIRNAGGAVHSVTEEHWQKYLTDTVDGVAYLKHGYTELTEKEAKAAFPQEFGAPDPAVIPTSKELEDARNRAAFQAVVAAEAAKVAKG